MSQSLPWSWSTLFFYWSELAPFQGASPGRAVSKVETGLKTRAESCSSCGAPRRTRRNVYTTKGAAGGSQLSDALARIAWETSLPRPEHEIKILAKSLSLSFYHKLDNSQLPNRWL